MAFRAATAMLPPGIHCIKRGGIHAQSWLDKALDEMNATGWTVADMKRDWKKVFPFDP